MLTLSVPADAVASTADFRLRISRLGNLTPLGLGGAGEVEDSKLEILRLPSVENLIVNGGETQRSQLTSVLVQFNAIVDAPEDAFTIIDRQTASAIGSVVVNNSIVDDKTQSLLTFDSGPGVIDRGTENSLVDGNYQFSIDASKVNLTGHPTLKMETDYMIGDEEVDRLFRYLGDNNADRKTDALDFSAFLATFQKSSSDAAFRAGFDNNGDNRVDALDFSAFLSRFNKRLDFN